jgi:hypothetical protein
MSRVFDDRYRRELWNGLATVGSANDAGFEEMSFDRILVRRLDEPLGGRQWELE